MRLMFLHFVKLIFEVSVSLYALAVQETSVELIKVSIPMTLLKQEFMSK
jgi:hypothetical protein